MPVLGDNGRGCPTYGPPITDNPIQAAVGLGGQNIPADVNTVQQLLNALSPLEGGPLQILAEDKLFGPLTQAAIGRYQNHVLGWADGRIDPNGPTIKSLATYVVDAPSVPYGKLGIPVSGSPGAGAANTGKAPSTDGAADIALAHSLTVQMEPRLHTLRFRLTRTNSRMLAWMDKHFASKNEKMTLADAGHVQTILGGIHHYIARVNAFGKLPLSNVILYDPSPSPRTPAHTVRGGDKLSTEQVQIYHERKTGKVIKSPGQSIWLTSRFRGMAMDEKRWLMLHEFAHFVGPRDGSFDKIHDYAYAPQSHFLTLSKFHKLHCAENLSLCFLEWCIGTDRIVATPHLKNNKAHYDQFPRITAAGDLVTTATTASAPSSAIPAGLSPRLF